MFPADETAAGPATEASPRRVDPGKPVEPRRILTALGASRRWLISVPLLAAGVGGVLAKTSVPRVYQAETILVWEPGGSAALLPEREAKTLLDTVKLPAHLEEVRKRTSLHVTLPALGKQIEVEPGKDSNVLSIFGKGSSPAEAEGVATAATNVFLEGRIEVERARARERLDRAAGEATQARHEYEEARQKYDDFRSTHGFWDLAAERQVAVQEEASLRNEAQRNRITAQAQTAKSAELAAAVRVEPSEVTLSATETRASERKLAEIQADLTAKKAALAPDHPLVLSLEAEVAALTTKGAPAVRADRVVGANQHRAFLRTGMAEAAAERTVAETQQRSYSDLHKAATARLADLAAAEGRVTALQAELHLAEERLIKTEAERRSVAEAVRSPTPGFRVLSPASAPLLPHKSYRRIVALALPILGLLFVVLTVLVRAALRLRPETPAEVTFWSRLPVVAASRWPRAPEDLADLQADLRLQLRGLPGTTLVMAAEPADAALAQALESRDENGAVPLRDEEDNEPYFEAAPVDAVSANSLRRAARGAARVLVLVRAGSLSPGALRSLTQGLGRTQGVAIAVIDLGTDLADIPDRAGDVQGYFAATATLSRPEWSAT